jgi:hypothetical protein
MATDSESITELRRIEETIRKSDSDGLVARWESGQYLNTLKKGKKQLPKGMLAELVTAIGFRRAEVNARMKFAATFTEAELTDVIGKFPTWYDITHKALTKTPRAAKTSSDEADSKQARKGIQRAIETIAEIDAALLGEGDRELLAALDAAVRRLKESVVILKAVA